MDNHNSEKPGAVNIVETLPTDKPKTDRKVGEVIESYTEGYKQLSERCDLILEKITKKSARFPLRSKK